MKAEIILGEILSEFLEDIRSAKKHIYFKNLEYLNTRLCCVLTMSAFDAQTLWKPW